MSRLLMPLPVFPANVSDLTSEEFAKELVKSAKTSATQLEINQEALVNNAIKIIIKYLTQIDEVENSKLIPFQYVKPLPCFMKVGPTKKIHIDLGWITATYTNPENKFKARFGNEYSYPKKYSMTGSTPEDQFRYSIIPIPTSGKFGERAFTRSYSILSPVVLKLALETETHLFAVRDALKINRNLGNSLKKQFDKIETIKREIATFEKISSTKLAETE